MNHRPVCAGGRGRLGRGARALDDRRFRIVDRDSFDAVMSRLAVSLAATVPNRLDDVEELALRLRFDSLEDFHPDRIAARVPALAALVKGRATVPSTESLDRLGLSSAPRRKAAEPPTPPPAEAAG